LKNRHRERAIGRREALRRVVAGAGASAALPALGAAAAKPAATMPHASMPEAPALGSAEPPDPSLSAADWKPLGSAEPPDPSLSAADWKPKFFDEHQNKTVIVLSDLIIPETDTPGAKAAYANRFIDLLLSVEAPEKQKQYLEALGWLDGYCLSNFGSPFVTLGPAQQNEMLGLLTRPSNDARISYGVKLFSLVKQSIVWAYYSSEIGTLKELKYETNPFQPEFPGCKHPEGH